MTTGIFTNEELVNKFKSKFNNWKNEGYQDADEIMIPILEELNKNDGLVTIYSCEGHISANRYDNFYIMFAVTSIGFEKLKSIYSKVKDKLLAQTVTIETETGSFRSTSKSVLVHNFSLSARMYINPYLQSNEGCGYYNAFVMDARFDNSNIKVNFFKDLIDVLIELTVE